MIGAILTGARFEAITLRHSPADLMMLLTAPLFTLAFVAIMVHAGRPDLVPYAVLGPAVMAIWGMALNVSGDVIATERQSGVLEAILTTPVSLTALVFGRIVTVTLVSMLSLAESVVVVWFAFGIRIPVPHGVIFALTLLATAIAMAGTATGMSALFVIARSARTFQNALSYPFYLLSGAVVPASLLPGWLQPFTRAVFLSWSADLMRAALQSPPVSDFLPRLAIVLALGVLGYTGGLWLMAKVLHRLRATGTIGYA